LTALMLALAILALLNAEPQTQAPTREQLAAVLVEVEGFKRTVDAWKRGDLRGADAKYVSAEGVTVMAHALWDEGLPIPLVINKKTGDFAHCSYLDIGPQRVLLCTKSYGMDRSAIYWARPGASMTVAIHNPSDLPEKTAAELVRKVANQLVAESIKRLP